MSGGSAAAKSGRSGVTGYVSSFTLFALEISESSNRGRGMRQGANATAPGWLRGLRARGAEGQLAISSSADGRRDAAGSNCVREASRVGTVDGMAAVDGKRGAGDEGGGVGGEIDHRLGDLGGLAGAPGGKLCVQLGPPVLVAEEPLRPRHHVRQVAAGDGRAGID